MPNFLRRLQRNESGNVLAMAAGLMPLLMGSAALAVDAAQLALWKRQLQRTADSAAIAGAYTVAQNGDADAINSSVFNDIDENPHPPLVSPPDIFADPQSVRVVLASQHTLPFASLFTDRATTITADATASLVPDGNYCMVSLYNGDETGIVITGNATVTLQCGMITNSTSEDAVSAGGSSEITASPIGAVGGLDGSTNNYVGGTTLIPYTAPQADPLAGLPNPNVTGCPGGDVVVSNNEVLLVQAGASNAICSLTVKPGGTVQFAPGEIYIYGGNVDLKGTVQTVAANGRPEGSTFIMTGPNGKAGEFDSNSQASIQIRPQASGPFADVSFYRDRRADFTEIKINGGSGSIFTGAYYFPTANLTFNGNANLTTTCLQLVALQLKFSGNFSLDNQCNNGPANGNFNRRIVRLVE